MELDGPIQLSLCLSICHFASGIPDQSGGISSFCSGIVDDAFSQRIRKMIWLDVSTGLCLQEFRAYEDIAILVADFIVIAQWNMSSDQTRGGLRKDFGIISDTLP